jgi:hypothetical protein
VGSLAALSAVKSGCSGGKVMANELTLSVNGAKQVVSAAPETPLLFVLRNELKLTNLTKIRRRQFNIDCS